MQCKPTCSIAQTNKAVCCWPQKAAYVQEAGTGLWGSVLCNNAEMKQSGMQCKTHSSIYAEAGNDLWASVLCIKAEVKQITMQCIIHRCNHTGKQGCVLLVSKTACVQKPCTDSGHQSAFCVTDAVHQCSAVLKHSSCMHCKTHTCN